MDKQAPLDSYADDFRANGYSVVDSVLAKETIESLRRALASISETDAVRKKKKVFGIRNLLNLSPQVRELSCSKEVKRYVEPILGKESFATRAVFFDKVEGSNWALGWHQDSVISVKEKLEVKGFKAWTKKAGVWQVHPPASILSRMLAIRVHLDDNNELNGPLRVIPGSHTTGWIGDNLQDWKSKNSAVTCLVGVGGIVAMSPLTLHASSAAQRVGNRRVVHIEYAADDLPGGLEWNNRIY